MPSGSKKRKANKKKKTNPNPNSQTPPPVPLHHQGNGHANHEDGEGEEEELFQTPRSQPPPDPLDVGRPGNGWSPRVPLDEVPEEKRDEEEEEEDDEEEGEDVVAAAGSLDDGEDPARTEGIVVVEEEPARVDYPHVEGKIVEDSARFYKARPGNPEVPVETVDDSASHDEKEVKIVPWQEGERLADRSESKSDEGLVEMAIEKSAREDPGITENHKVSVDGVDSTSHEGEGKELPQVDEGLKDAQLYKLVEEKYTLTENPTLVTEEVSQQSEAAAENLNKILVGVVDTTPTPPQEASDPSANAARTEIAPRSEVACGPLVVRRATLWNCCGLLDVFTGSQR